MKPVDSKQKQLPMTEVIQIAGMNDNSPYDLRELLMRTVMELSLPNVTYKQLGNTLFSAMDVGSRVAYVKAFNADTEENFLPNYKKFTDMLYLMGFDGLVTDFDNEDYSRVFDYIVANKSRDGMGYELNEMSDYTYQVVMGLGPAREGEEARP